MANAIQLTTEQIELLWHALETYKVQQTQNLNKVERAISARENYDPADSRASILPSLYEKRAEFSALLVDITNTDTEITRQAF
jgi:hypothetical protein